MSTEHIWNTGWQPIETAPKDGTLALFFQPGNPKAEVVRARTPEMRIDHYKHPNRLFYRELPESRYTHWMPLPPPPSEIEGGEG